MSGGLFGKKRKRADQDFYLQITSLIDTLVIILVFMLMTLGSGNINLEMAGGVKLLWTVEGAELTQGLKLIARLDGISLDTEAIVPLKAGEVAGAATSEAGRKIVPLFNKLAATARESQAAAKKSGVKFEGRVLLQADKDLPLKTVKQVLYTAGRAGFHDFRFAVVRQ